MAKYYSGITTGTTLDTMLASGSEFGVFPSQDIDCANINVSGIHTVTGILDAGGGIKDSSDSIGTSGKVLSSTGSGLAWIDPSEGSTANAVNVGTNENSTDADQFVAFMGASSGNNPVRVDTDLKYNPSTNILNVGNVKLPNLGEFSLGDNQELKMFHKDDTSDVRVEVGSSTNYILLTKNFDLKNAAGSKAAITANDPGGVPEVRLHHDGNERLKTTNDGVTITGDLTVTDIIANGNIDLGSDANDTLTISAKVDSDIVPSGTTRDLGGNSDRWRNLYATTIRDRNNQTGSSGQILSSTGSELDWITAGDLAAGSASQIAVTGVSDQTLTYVVLTGNNTGNQSPRSNTSLTFNSTNGTLSATKFVGDELNVNGTTQIKNGNVLQFETATNNNVRGFIGATETNDRHLIIATSGGEDIAFRDGGLSGTTNMVIRGDGNVIVTGGITATQPACLLTDATTVNVSDSTNNTPFGFNTIQTNVGCTVNSAKSRITVPSAGTYLVSACIAGIRTNSTVPTDSVKFVLHKGGSVFPDDQTFPGGVIGTDNNEEFNFTFTLPLVLAADDYLEILLINLNSSGGTATINKGYFSVTKLH